jgi:hypothetical protein
VAAWAQAPVNVQVPAATAPLAELRGTYSHPGDANYLYDQIELKIEFAGSTPFVVATRPGENIYLTIPDGKNSEKRMSLVVMPAPFGEKPLPRHDLLTREPASIGFRMLPYCLNTPANSNVTDKTTFASCLSRSVEDEEDDFVLPLSGKMQKDIAVGEKVTEVIPGVAVTILGYGPSDLQSFQEHNPYSKCCGTNSAGVEVCACTVLSSPTSSCGRGSGCRVSDSMTAALGSGS